MGLLTFIAFYLSTTYMNDTPAMMLMCFGLAFGLGKLNHD
jgi:hypothetical protein